MYSLHLTCSPEDVDFLSSELWERGTIGIREIESGEDVQLIAGFESNAERGELLDFFRAFAPEWEAEEPTDWNRFTHESWPARSIGNRIFLAAPWRTEETPPGRVRVVHNPGLACGTGEHPCTQLALMALEESPVAGAVVVDIGTGSGVLAIAALRLGAKAVVGIDPDAAALGAARENFELNGFAPVLAAGSAECVAEQAADITIANISGTVLLSILEDLVRITARRGRLILTGFTESELAFFERLFPDAAVSGINEWRCVTATIF